MTTPIYRAAVVGLGQVGLLFDSDVRRSGIWTHFTAYERLSTHLDLISVCDPDKSRQTLAKTRRPMLSCYDSVAELLNGERVDIVSLCTPPEFHAEQIALCAGRVKAIVCEKPLSTHSQSARPALEACRSAGTLLVVNYYKRFDGLVPRVKAMLDDRRVAGDPSRVDDRYSIPLRTESNILVQLHNVGPRQEFVFEMDAIGDGGRIRLLNNCDDCEFLRYRDSDRYSGYRELYPVTLESREVAERFLPLFLETIEFLRGERRVLTSDGENALRTQLLIDEIADHLTR
jgi:predicted dehydrogenase